MSKRKRYCIQRIESEDKEKRLIVWKNTKKCSDDLQTLIQMSGGRCRIFDRETGKVVYENS